jgi:antitoxin component of RelBE/YafQ-DinJ toxin-antitoxin module
MATETPFIAARVEKALKRRISKACKATGLRESDLLRVAVEEFIAKTADEQIASVIRAKTAQP